MRALMIGPEQLARIAAVKAHAEANVIPFVRIYRIAHGLEAPYFTPDFLAEIPSAFERSTRSRNRSAASSGTSRYRWTVRKTGRIR